MQLERRKYPRVATPFDGAWSGASGGSTCRIADIGWGGCFINTLAMAVAGERTVVTLKVGHGVVELHGTVVNPVRALGFAVEFDPMTAGQIAALTPVLGARSAAMEFSHVGLITDVPRAGEVFVDATRVWITDFVTHPFHVEWLRFEPDSPVTGPVRHQPHVAYRVLSIDEASRGLRVLLAPFQPLPNLRVGFYQSDDGIVIELMEYSDSPFEAGG